VRSLLEDRGRETHVTVLTTLNVTGKPAQFGRGVMNEVGGKLLSIFASNLAAMLAQADDELAGTAAPKAEVTLEDLNLSPRALASLHKAGITTVSQLTAKPDDEVLAIEGIGPASVDEIKTKLAEHGLALCQAAVASAGAAEEKPAAGEAPAAASAAGAGPAATNGVAGSIKASANGARTGATAAAPPRSTSGPTHVHQDEALNLLRVAGMPVLKRSIPVLAGVTAVIIISWRRRRRHRRTR
jgi:hypothetical protein